MMNATKVGQTHCGPLLCCHALEEIQLGLGGGSHRTHKGGLMGQPQGQLGERAKQLE